MKENFQDQRCIHNEKDRESIEAIINHAADDRITSKKTTKELTFVEASKKTEYLTYYSVFFDAYRRRIPR